MRLIGLSFLLLGAASITEAFAPRPSLLRSSHPQQRVTNVRLREATIDTERASDMFFASVQPNDTTASLKEEPSAATTEQRRVLGSQELLMLPRQYGPNPNVQFPHMNHVSVAILSATPSIQILRQAIDQAMIAHPLLQCHVQGDGEPEQRIDLFQMVRKGDPNPLTFVSQPGSVSVDDVLSVVNVAGSDPAALTKSWTDAFAINVDDCSWCDVTTGPLWKLEFHQLEQGSKDSPCAMIFMFNHAVSDQSSANRLTDQMVRNLAELEEKGTTTSAMKHTIPMALEDSVMGEEQRWHNVQMKGISWGTLGYVTAKASEVFKGPVILPDAVVNGDSGGNPLGGEDEVIEKRRSTLAFRTLSKEATAALLIKCRENGVTVTNALTAAVTLTATDFIDNGQEKKDQKRYYKVLQSLDMRRFGEQLDEGDTVACMAGSMDLLHGPLADRSGRNVCHNASENGLNMFWSLAKDGKRQTENFVASDGPRHAVRVFDFAMSISDMNNFIHLTAQSENRQGRAYSAGMTNVGVYDRQPAFKRQGETERMPLQVQHGRYKVKNVFFATSHARTGCLYQVSCLTVDGELSMTFHPVAPIVSDETNQRFADAFVDLLEVASGVRDASSVEEANGGAGFFSVRS